MTSTTHFAHHSLATLKPTAIRQLALLIFAYVLSVSVSAQIQVGDTAPSFTLADQFGSQTVLQFPQNAFVLLVFADRSGRLVAKRWLQALGDSPTAPELISVACTGWVPAMFQSVVRKAFEPNKPVLIDWNDVVAKQYGYTSGFRLIAISPPGRIIAIEEGEYSLTRFAVLSRLLH